MKIFVLNNWYKIAIAFSAVTFSSALFIYAVRNNTAQASPHFKKEFKGEPQSAYQHVVALPDGKIYGVRCTSSVFNKWEADLLTQVEVNTSR